MTDAAGVEPLRNYTEFRQSLRNFESWLDGVVPGATDIDCLIERHGHFLVFEAKPWLPGVALGYGQHLALYHLSQQPNTRVYLVGEEARADKPPRLYLVAYNEAKRPRMSRRGGKTNAWWGPERFIPSTVEGLRQIVRAWWDEASE